LVAFFTCAATIFYYTAKSPVIFPSQSWSQMGIDPAVLALIGPVVPAIILFVVFCISFAVVLSDNYEHAYGTLFAATGVPVVIFTILKTVVWWEETVVRLPAILLAMAIAAASAQENSSGWGGNEIKTGSYWKPTLGTKIQLGVWATVNPARLKDVELVFCRCQLALGPSHVYHPNG
jgi:hypothetical protein